MLYWLSNYSDTPFRIFKYLTFRSAGAALIAFLLVVFLAPMTARILRDIAVAPQRLAGFVSEEELCKLKEKTPAMGGILIIAAIVLSTLLWARIDGVITQVCLYVLVGFTCIGFWDDFRKVRQMKGRLGKNGVSGKLRLILEALIAVAAIFMLDSDPTTWETTRLLTMPFLKDPIFTQMPFWAAALFGVTVLIGTCNGVNLSDGMDGLAAGAVSIATITYMVIAYLAGNAIFAGYLNIPFIDGCGEAAVFGAAIVGACVGFLWHNAKPAIMFMGDTGSLPLGGALAMLAIIVKQELALVIIGGVFVMESLSVILQVGYFKATGGRRIFKMSPLHHHFQKQNAKNDSILRGHDWSETQIVTRFWILAILCAVAGLATLKIR